MLLLQFCSLREWFAFQCHNVKAVSSYTLNSWQNQPGKTDQTDHKPVHEGNLMACTNEPK